MLLYNAIIELYSVVIKIIKLITHFFSVESIFFFTKATNAWIDKNEI